MSSETLIDLGSIGPGDRTDIKQSALFILEWNKRFPKYHAFMKKNPHDFGNYTSVEIEEETFFQGVGNKDDFPAGGIEEQSIALADELKLDY